ncbi:zinc-ribbon domain-containing protein [Aliiroseovarius sp. M344]|uniref:zinc-ribbon domain-containing protein n=1 Tax=Aliiroseovarius sp. M344 TaxID=2867010 RepID=UPI0021ADF7FA|nr:zinc-ribbon domain-containing protein [Aliiroseovarius sp. M344]UWQ14023.1 zinc-ribbon domain-containing protein [Aliiroseovarius sp. M344]
MRLVCPSCGAQYEVDDRVMPESGRDVQCSNCGHAWFQLAPSAEARVKAEEEAAPSPFDNIDEMDEEATEVFDEAVEAETSEPDLSDDDQTEDSGDDAPSTPARQLDDDVRSILQEEAAKELKARDDERESLETQTDLGLDEAPGTGSDSTKRTLADVEPTDQDEQPLASDDLKRSDVLPDIEEINSTLDAPAGEAGSTAVDAVDGEEFSPNSFRRGYILVIVLACILAILYIYAPAIGERIPAIQPILDQYVEVADRVRVGLERMMRSAIGKMQGLIDKPE